MQTASNNRYADAPFSARTEGKAGKARRKRLRRRGRKNRMEDWKRIENGGCLSDAVVVVVIRGRGGRKEEESGRSRGGRVKR